MSSLEFTLKALGWVMAGLPVSIFLFISIVMLRGVSKDDSVVVSLITIGLAVFGLGVGILALMYLTDFSVHLVR